MGRVEVKNVNHPGGAKAGWWAKSVQLDLEARGIIKRVKTSPLRLYRA